MESSAAAEARRLRMHVQPLPRTIEEIVALFKRVVELPHTHEIKLTPAEFSVQRMVADGESVVPSSEDEVAEIDPADLLTALEKSDALHQLKFDPERHPYQALEFATRMITSFRLRPSHIVAPSGEWLSAFLDLTDPRPERVFGMQVVYTDKAIFEDKILVVGGPTTMLIDASVGVIINMGS